MPPFLRRIPAVPPKAPWLCLLRSANARASTTGKDSGIRATTRPEPEEPFDPPSSTLLLQLAAHSIRLREQRIVARHKLHPGHKPPWPAFPTQRRLLPDIPARKLHAKS